MSLNFSFEILSLKKGKSSFGLIPPDSIAITLEEEGFETVAHWKYSS